MLKKSYQYFLIALLALGIQGVASAADEEAAAEKKPAYVSLGQPMVLNLTTGARRLSFLQIEADVLVANDDAKDVVETHIPAIRHQLVLLLSEQKAMDMKTPTKREALRQQATQDVRNIIAELNGSNDGIEEVLFSTVLVQ